MPNTTEALLLLCRCLRRGQEPERLAALRGELAAPRIELTELARVASEHLLTPALFGALGANDLLRVLPAELRTYLGGVHALNLERNQRLKAQALEIAAILNRIGVEPVLLKGGIHLFDPGFGDPNSGDANSGDPNSGDPNSGDMGARMMFDLDMAVPKASFEPSLAALKSAGFAAEDREWIYHYPPLARPGDRATLELHLEIAEQRSVLPAAEGLRAAIPLPSARPARLRTLSPTHQVWHNVFHAQVQDRKYLLGTLALRQLHDLVSLDERYGARIDWDAVARRMRAQGLARELEAYLHQANTLFDARIAAGRAVSMNARLHLGRCLAQTRWPALRAVVMVLGTVSHPFRRYHIELIYGRVDGRASRFAKRLRHAVHLLTKYRLGSFERYLLIHKNRYT